MKLQALTGTSAFKLLKATFDGWMEDNALRLSAALAYYSIFSIAPLLVIAMSLAGLVFGAEAVRGEVSEQLKQFIGPQAAESVQSMIQSTSEPTEGWLGTIIGTATLLLGASGVFGQLKDALNTVWEVKAKGGAGIMGFVRERLLNFGMVLVIGFLLLTSLLLTAALAAVSGFFGDAAGLSPVLAAIFGFIVSLSVVTVLFAFIFKVLPDAEVKWGHVWIGALVTGLLFEAGKFGLSFYLGRESTASGFGAAGSVVLLLLWVDHASCILLFGAEFTQVYAKEKGHAILPARGAVAVTAEKRAEEGISPAKGPAPSRTLEPMVRTEIITVEARPATGHPFGMLLAVTAASCLIGLVTRRPAAAQVKPTARIREGFAELGGQTLEQVAELLQRLKVEAKHRMR